MAILCDCPLTGAINGLLDENCRKSIGQWRKLIIQRTADDAGVDNVITVATTDPADVATWTALAAAVDESKVVFSPKIYEFTPAQHETQEYAGGDASPDGETIPLRELAADQTYKYIGTSAALERALKELNCWNTVGLSIFIVGDGNRIWGYSNDDGVTFKGIRVNKHYVGAKMPAVNSTIDSNPVTIGLPSDWGEYLYPIDTNFDPMKNLVNP